MSNCCYREFSSFKRRADPPFSSFVFKKKNAKMTNGSKMCACVISPFSPLQRERERERETCQMQEGRGEFYIFRLKITAIGLKYTHLEHVLSGVCRRSLRKWTENGQKMTGKTEKDEGKTDQKKTEKKTGKDRKKDGKSRTVDLCARVSIYVR